ncbi:antitoxin VbhA family protein [Haemophilus haemolyticus]|uniref:antitoxin VbhA family protein n=1 Tax=Haemophilus haemolyticus TaxID=726 RepID=UPI0002DA0EC2|nr:antitoxin VbhA family protein [Haemophilus haemolyticus]
MTQREYESRQRAVQFALDNNRLEGLTTDDDLLQLSQEWMKGNISYQQLQDRVYEIYGI